MGDMGDGRQQDELRGVALSTPHLEIGTIPSRSMVPRQQRETVFISVWCVSVAGGLGEGVVCGANDDGVPSVEEGGRGVR